VRPGALAELRTGLALFGTGASVIGVAFAIRPVHASAAAFWSVAVVGFVACAMGFVPLLRQRGRHFPWLRANRPPGWLLDDCRGVSDAITDLLADRERVRPHGPFGTERLNGWRAGTTIRYHDEVRSLALGVFDEAVAAGVVSPRRRTLVADPSAEQLLLVRDLFRAAADRLALRRPHER
jgi:hypothetical protein